MITGNQLLHEINKEGWHSLIKYTLDIPEGTPTQGFKIFYRATNGKLYSAYHPTPEYTEDHLDDLPVFEEGHTYSSPEEERGYYYWANSEIAKAYLYATQKKHPPPKGGEYVLREVQGTALARHKHDEGDRMQDMTISFYDPHVDINLET